MWQQHRQGLIETEDSKQLASAQSELYWEQRSKIGGWGAELGAQALFARLLSQIFRLMQATPALLSRTFHYLFTGGFTEGFSPCNNWRRGVDSLHLIQPEHIFSFSPRF